MMARSKVGVPFSEAKPLPEMLSTISDPGLEVFQVTTDLDAEGDTRGMEHLFTPDSKRFVFLRHRPREGSDPRIEFVLCEIDQEFQLRLLTEEDNARAPFISLDGKYFGYFVDHTAEEKPRIAFRRVDLDTFKVETVTVYDSPVAGVGRRPRGGMSRGCSLRSDGRKVCIGCNFAGDDGENHFAPAIVDLETLEAHTFEWEPYSWRVGGTYYRGNDPAHVPHLLMVRCHRSQHWDKEGKYSEKWYSDMRRATLHVVTEEGRNIATIPIGDDGEGVDHPYWRGGRYEVVTHTSDFKTAPHWRGVILCAEPVACAPEDQHKGARIPGARRFEMTRKIRRPDVCHMCWNQSGKRVVCDTEGWHARGEAFPMGPTAYLWIGTVVEKPGEDPYIVPKHLVHPLSSWNWARTENCPALSPDCRTVLFNSDYLCTRGRSQVFAVRGFEFPTV
ncbi:MAG: hypothetical protein HYU36_23830 [Planctomycetes bacterium]|nr:hypothetical protein [Planctomycetota bacterium]